MKWELISHAKVWHKLYSIRFALLSALFGIWDQIDSHVATLVPAHLFAILSIIFAVLAALSRVIMQQEIKDLTNKN